jgi:hypothetical protein
MGMSHLALSLSFWGIGWIELFQWRGSSQTSNICVFAKTAHSIKRKIRAALSDLNEVRVGNPAVSGVIRSVAFRLPVTRDLALENGTFSGRQMRRPSSFS